MKTAISMPDETFERATRRAKELGMSRSELLSLAVNQYLDKLDSSSLTRRINQALMPEDKSGQEAVAVGRALLSDESDGW